jgi:hypothetical protein
MNNDPVLLPRPRNLVRLDGSFALQSARYILLDGARTPGLERAGMVVKEALAEVGAALELTAHRGGDPNAIAAQIGVASRRIRQPEGYRLTIGPDGIALMGHDLAGVLYGAMTLRQLARQNRGAGSLPWLTIDDWPDLPNRGIMLDVTRDRVPTMETLYGLVDLLAEWKINQLQLYTEHTYAYRDHEDVWKDASPMTGEEVMALDAYCRDRAVELVPNQNSFGHMERWLARPGYAGLAENPNDPIPRSLDPGDTGSVMLLDGMFDELLPHFSSRQFNVGLDEVPLGDGKSKDAVAEHGVGRVYLDFVLKVHELVRGHGRRSQVWGDIVIHYPELIPELPDDMIALEWGYEATHPFAEECAQFGKAGVPFYVCPGTASWNSLTGRTDNAMQNILSAVSSGIEHGAIGILNTDWGDNGHWQPLPVAYLGMAYGAAVGWCLEANRDIDLPPALDLHAFDDSAGKMGRVAYDLGNTYLQPGVVPRNSSVLHNILLRSPSTEEPISRLSVEGLERTEAHIESTLQQMGGARMGRPDGDLVKKEFANAAGLSIHACHVGEARLKAVGNRIADVPRKTLWTHHHTDELPAHVSEEIAAMPSETRRRLASELGPLIAEYRRLWRARSRPGGLDDSVTRWEAMLAAYRG